MGLALVSFVLPAHAAETAPPPKAQMRQIAGALKVALPLALSGERFNDPKNRAALEKALAQLAAGGAALERHGFDREAPFAFMSHALARDAADIQRRFQEGRREEARFLLGELLQECVGCHSRLPASKDSDLGRSLYQAVDTESLSPMERARLQLATRQFGAALDSYEALLASPLPPADLDLEGVPAEYLLVAVRIRQDLPRARATLERFRARKDLPPYLAAHVDDWLASLAVIQLPVPAGDELDAARRLAQQGQAQRRFPADRSGLVYDLAASGLLHQVLAAKPGPSPQTAEACYLLGLAELRSDTTYWLSEAPFYLETAIWMAPGSPIAKRAYAVLEEDTLASYAGTDSDALPDDVAEWLARLRTQAGAGVGGSSEEPSEP